MQHISNCMRSHLAFIRITTLQQYMNYFYARFFFSSNQPVTSDTAMCLEYGATTRPVTTLNETFHHMLHERAVLRAVLTDAPSMMNKCVLE